MRLYMLQFVMVHMMFDNIILEAICDISDQLWIGWTRLMPFGGLNEAAIALCLSLIAIIRLGVAIHNRL